MECKKIEVLAIYIFSADINYLCFSVVIQQEFNSTSYSTKVKN